MNKKHYLFSYLLISVLSIMLWLGLSWYGFLDGLDQEALRWSYLVRGEKPAEDPVVFVDLDAYAISQIGDKPWDRLNYAQTIHALLGPGKARAVGVDLVFSIFGASSLLDVDKARKGDLRFGQVVEAFHDRLVLAAIYSGTTSTTAELPLLRNGFRDPANMPFPEAPTYPIIKYNAGRLGLANVDEEWNMGTIPYVLMAFVETEGNAFSRHLVDGKMRHFSTVLQDAHIVERENEYRVVDSDGFGPPGVSKYSKRLLLTLGLEVFLAAHGLDASAVEYDTDELRIRKEGEVFRRIPLVGEQSIEVNWLEGWGSVPSTKHYSMGEVLNQANLLGQAAKEGDSERVAELESWFSRFQDKVIFFGPVDATLKDLAPTPYDRVPVPKVALHANLYRMLVEEAYIQRLEDWHNSLITIVLTAVLVLLAILSGQGGWITRIGVVVLLFAYILCVFLLFAAQNWILPLIVPVGSSLTAVLFVGLLKLGSEEWQRRRIKTIFGSYLPPQLVDEMVDSQRDPELGGAEAEITALFSDVEGFTALSENLPPEQLVALMNEYLGAMTEAVYNQGGTLDKYIGDAMVTMFGMPLPIEDHAVRACMAALRMQERHAQLREGWARSGRWPDAVSRMRTRIGVNTGRAVIGNMGSEVRFNYTMMGDSVNLAARCESGAKAYGVYTLITENTMESCLVYGCTLNLRKLDRVVVQGRREPVEIYELWDSTVDADHVEQCRELYEAGLEHYFAGRWEAALDLFEQSAAFEPGRDYAPTTPSVVLGSRCRTFMEQGGPEDWNGVYQMQAK
ncbi:MAG: adenylate/guanylate cyclase domain-containing protein [Coraliomargarita sp. TMED73]|nr:MAG: adenylate/guanylate cyclase domain-containing protein [Coraliomargarita sp. TMED73]